MDKKNLEIYLKKYKNISLDDDRLKNYLDQVNISDKQMNLVAKNIERIKNIRSNILKIVFYIIPEATPRPRLSRRGKVVYVKNARSNSDFLKLLAEKEKDLLHMIHTPCKFNCDVYFPIPNDMNIVDTILCEKRYIKHIKIPDWDNIGKTYSDMIQKYILLNDSLIYEGTVRKFYSLKPRVEITIEYLLNYDCKYNKRIVKKSKYYHELFRG